MAHFDKLSIKNHVSILSKKKKKERERFYLPWGILINRASKTMSILSQKKEKKRKERTFLHALIVLKARKTNNLRATTNISLFKWTRFLGIEEKLLKHMIENKIQHFIQVWRLRTNTIFLFNEFE